MNFRTTLPISKSELNIGHNNKILLLGSCFAENIGSKFDNHLFDTIINPLGISYHPSNILQQLTHNSDKQSAKSDSICQIDNQYVDFDYHSVFNAPTPQNLKNNIYKSQILLNKKMGEIDYVFISLGSAWGFYHKQLDRIIANCHKQDAALFDRKLSSHQELVSIFRDIIAHLTTVNPNIHIVFTISPVRHIRYGMIQNNQGKARLLSAVAEVLDCVKNASYFPSYELIMDDLRDYRFYNEDMLHPNSQAIDYIWNYLTEYYFDEPTINVCKKISKLNKMLHHRPMSKDRDILHKYKLKLKEKIAIFENEYPTFNVDKFQSKLDLLA